MLASDWLSERTGSTAGMVVVLTADGRADVTALPTLESSSADVRVGAEAETGINDGSGGRANDGFIVTAGEGANDTCDELVVVEAPETEVEEEAEADGAGVEDVDTRPIGALYDEVVCKVADDEADEAEASEADELEAEDDSDERSSALLLLLLSSVLLVVVVASRPNASDEGSRASRLRVSSCSSSE